MSLKKILSMNNSPPIKLNIVMSNSLKFIKIKKLKMKNIILFSMFIIFSAIFVECSPILSTEKYKGVRVIITKSVEEKLNIKMISSKSIPTVQVTLISAVLFLVSAPVVSEGTNVNLYNLTASNSLYKFNKNEFKSILNDIEMRKLDDIRN